MDQPPTYSEVVAGHQPTAPLMSENKLVFDQPANVPGWSLNRYSQDPVMAQPMVQQQDFHNQMMHQQQQMAPQQTIVIINQQLNVETDPVIMICPHCKQHSITKIDNVNTCGIHCAAALLCCVGLVPCALMMYCTNYYKNAVHTCEKCNGYIGTYRREANRHRYGYGRYGRNSCFGL